MNSLTSSLRLRKLLGIDFHIGLSLAFRLWSILAGAVMVVFVPSWFSKTEQGYYYTFASLIGLQVFFELGINQVVVQLVGHEMAGIDIMSSGELRGTAKSIERLKSIVRMLKRWYLYASCAFFLVVSVAGIFFFQQRGSMRPADWVGGWLLLVAFSSGNLYFSPMLAVLEGCGQVGQVARLRVIQSVAGYGLLWVALSSGLGLWAVPAVSGVAVACTASWILSKGSFLRHFRDAKTGAPLEHTVSWKTEIFPFQWRIALSWISGYFMLQLFTPMTFAHHGAAEAGKLGIALSIFTALMTVGMTWVNAKLPTFARLISRGDRAELNRVFVSSLARSLAFTVMAVVALLLAVYGLSAIRPQWIDRIAALPVLGFIGVASIGNVFIFAAAGYMRAHREEPLLAQSIVVGILVALSVYATAHWSVEAMMMGYCAVTLLVSLPWAAFLLSKYYRRTS